MSDFKKISIFLLVFFYLNSLFSFQFEEIIKKNFSDRKLDILEGLWEKTYANQGSTGCITMFYKVEENLFRAEFSINLFSLTVLDIRTNSCLIILPAPMVRWPTSELPICSSGRPTSAPLASIRVCG